MTYFVLHNNLVQDLCSVAMPSFDYPEWYLKRQYLKVS